LLCGGAAIFEELHAGTALWVFSSCQVRRRIKSICCHDWECPKDQCCQLSLAFGGIAEGKCVTRDPVSGQCSRPRRCKNQWDCNVDECCRLDYQNPRYRVGVCDKLGQESDTCTARPMYYPHPRSRRWPVVCPCADGFDCVRDVVTDKTGWLLFDCVTDRDNAGRPRRQLLQPQHLARRQQQPSVPPSVAWMPIAGALISSAVSSLPFSADSDPEKATIVESVCVHAPHLPHVLTRRRQTTA
ncbi:hypothetical protein BaRGS_00031326, partial [Batillaria attramentaria]